MPSERTSSGFGARLRDARERRGVSLRQIADATKISVAVLEALERNDISRLPGGIFGRAFVRSYAVEVGLDPEATIQDFITQFPNDSVVAGHPPSDQVEDNVAVESERRTAGTFLWMIVVSVPIAAALLYFATIGRHAAADAGPPAPVGSSTPSRAAAAAAARAGAGAGRGVAAQSRRRPLPVPRRPPPAAPPRRAAAAQPAIS